MKLVSQVNAYAHSGIIVSTNISFCFFQCQQILDEYEDDVVTLFRSSADNIDIRLCSQAAGLCNQSIDEEYVFEDERDEL